MEFDVKTLGLIYESFHRFVSKCFHEQKFKKVTNVDFFQTYMLINTNLP